MKRVLVILLVLLAFLVPTMGQENPLGGRVMPKDSLPDLWIVTIDLSGSMIHNNEQNVKSNTLIHKKVSDMLSANHIREKDSVIIMRSGIDKTELLSSVDKKDVMAYFRLNKIKYNHKPIDFAATLVQRETSDVKSWSEALSYIEKLCANDNNFKYSLSFTALVRPLSIYALTRAKTDFLNYRNIYHMLVSDDGDVDDQWNNDYHYLKRYTPLHFDTVCGILPKVACGNFDFAAKKTARFYEVCPADDSVQPHVYLTQYITYQDNHPDMTFASKSLLDVSDFHNNSFVVSMKSCNDSICFVYVDECYVNENRVVVGSYLFPGDSLAVAYPDTLCKFFGNKISATGYYQEKYTDRILGSRYRTVAYEGPFDQFFVSAETQNAERMGLKACLWLLLAVVIFIIILRNYPVLNIQVDDKRYFVRRKALKKLRNGDYTLMTIVCGKEKADVRFFYERGFVYRPNSRRMGKKNHVWNHDYHELIIDSTRKLKQLSSDLDFVRRRRKHVKAHFDVGNDGDKICFSYNGKLSHSLIIRIVKEGVELYQSPSSNELQERNINMLSQFAEQDLLWLEKGKRISAKNHVQVNIIEKETLNAKSPSDYAILNIYDYNSRNSVDYIFLRYSLMCVVDLNQTTKEAVAKKLMRIARYVLRSEGQKAGWFNEEPYDEQEPCGAGLNVDVSPMLSYLYLLKKGASRLAYSPFKDGCLPLADGRPGLVRKAIEIFSQSAMTLLNLPFRLVHPETIKEGPNRAGLEKRSHDSEYMDFDGNDRIRFMNVNRDWSYGSPDNSIEGITFRAWNLDTLMQIVN